jgi:hypothetical protein
MTISSIWSGREAARKPAFSITAVALVVALASCKPSSNSSSSSPVAYFEFGDSSHKDVFVFATDKPAIIQQARRILSGEEKTQTKVTGTIVKSSADYNPNWSFHVDPGSVTFAQTSNDACDATTQSVSERLDDVGTTFLPGAQWCPSSSQLIMEVTAPFPKAAATDCFRYRPLDSGDKMELRNTCNVCKTAIIHYSYPNPGNGAQAEPKEFKVLGHASAEIDTSGASRTDLIDQKDCKK